MNLLNTKWINRQNLKITYQDNKIIIENNFKTHKFLVYPKIFKSNSDKILNISMNGNLIEGNGCVLKVLNRRKMILSECGLNSKIYSKLDFLKYFIFVLYIPASSKVELTELEFNQNKLDNSFDNFLDSDTLVITPGYPSHENKYNTAFVHSRVLEYKKAGLNPSVLVINSLPENKVYTYEQITVVKSDFFYLRELLSRKKYKRLLVHFFDDTYANVFDSVDLTETQLYLYLHGADVLYRDFPKFASNYFEEDINISYRESEFLIKDYYFKKYNSLPNVKWIFVSEFLKNRAETLHNIKFNNYEIIPCTIDNSLYKYEEKDPDLRKRIFILRKFTNDKCYAIDIDIRVILELSKKPFFNELDFDIYGDGEMFDILTKPVEKFKNVHLHRKFLSHKEIREVHETHGIALFATRFDTQGVSLCEAAASGCAVITSNIPTVKNYINPDLGVTCTVEDFKEYANVIEKMFYDESYFLNVAKEEANSVNFKFGYANTIEKELNLFNSEKNCKFLTFNEQIKKPILTVVIPAYNVEKYLWNGVMSLLNTPYSNKLEILIVNDGSRDNTSKIGEKLQNLTKVNNKSIVRLINKENGGHGSTINKGIEEARGKYLKIMDGDDTVDSYSFSKLIEILENEDTDIILNNYIEDFANSNLSIRKDVYNFMLPGFKYNFDDLCYENYGFKLWGPILSCSTYKTDMLKKMNFKLSEHCFYVDMELNTNISIACNTIKFYPLYIYRYLLGRENQSVTKCSYMKNYKNHEKVTLNIIKILYDNEKKLSNAKRNYIVRNLILVMIKTQYIVTVEFFKKGKPFREFEKELKKFPEFYNNTSIITNGIKFHRLTHGYFIKYNSFLIRIKNFVLKVFRRFL